MRGGAFASFELTQNGELQAFLIEPFLQRAYASEKQ
jgi:hypothetical protein